MKYLNSILFGFIAFVALTQPGFSQSYDSIERGRMKDILKNVKNSIKKNYYDQTFRGIDLDARFEKASQRLSEVKSTSEAFGVIAQVVIEFNDSHLVFIPPSTNLAVEYGWRIKMVGDKCFVTHVRPGSDAEKKGVKVGDQVLMLENFRVSRADLWKMSYFYNVISKRSSMKLTLLSPGSNEPRIVVAESEIKRQPQKIIANTYFRLFDDFYDERNSDNRYMTLGPVTAWKFPSFSVDPQYIETLIDRPKKSQSMIIDLRGNGGGYVASLEKLVGHLFDKDIAIAELKGLKKMDPIRSKTLGGGAFKGKIVVLIDSESASAAEILARVVQLEERGVVLGDVSSGKVMQSRTDIIKAGVDSIYAYGVSVTNADVIMADGKSLETIGVTPDEIILPTAEDMAAGRDPVMARAFEIAGSKIDPAAAGKFFPYFWGK